MLILSADKVDFDILGVQNSMMKVALEVEKVEAPWTDDDWGNVSCPTARRHVPARSLLSGQTVVQQKIVRTPLKEESLLEYAPK